MLAALYDSALHVTMHIISIIPVVTYVSHTLTVIVRGSCQSSAVLQKSAKLLCRHTHLFYCHMSVMFNKHWFKLFEFSRIVQEGFCIINGKHTFENPTYNLFTL